MGVFFLSLYVVVFLFSISFFEDYVRNVAAFLSSSVADSSACSAKLSAVSGFIVPLVGLSSEYSVLFLLEVDMMVFRSDVYLNGYLV